MEQEDEQLVLRARQGDERAAGQLFERHRESAYRIAYHHLGRVEDALDVVQDAFIKALSGLAGLQEPSRFRSWLLRIVTNQARDLGRRRRRRNRLGLDASGFDDEQEGQPQPVDQRNPAEEVEAQELERGIGQALQELDDGHREVLLLVSQGGLSYREVAEELSIPIGTVMSRLHYARRTIRDWLAERGYL